MKQRKAFTLAEVLITLGVIGVVAALTIPVVINYAFEREAVSKAKETYSLLAQAVAAWQVDSGCVGETENCPELSPKAWPGGAFPHNAPVISRAIASHLKVSDSLYGPSFADYKAKDWVPEISTELSGFQQDYTSLYPSIGKNIAGCGDPGYNGYLLLSNGVVVKIMGISWIYDISFDINGPKRPNRVGKDQFVASLYSPNHKTFNPYYYSSYGSGYGVCRENDEVCNADDGKSPLAYVLKHDKLPNLKTLGYPLAP